MKNSTKLPRSLYRFFWDINAKMLNPSKHPKFVINRLLDKGDIEAVKWVRRNFSENEIEKTFKKLRDFRPKVASFWSLFLNIPKKEIICLQEPYLSMRKKHWSY
ncbi:hypothetical protein A3I50_01350 [Candidatus Roizmanbacteria bacterium RIFCSPLOWO2_02_FULL_37_9]|nr:MAG: hypothetical protein A2859_00860 [Candidatus Roizmanbacteria bacterium RIFCSPHIGHO2_01_FULL_37_16b]OGK56605.1 MAG: hypothetical protein A3I50_01350 [Candidatus Roizmanbacteria bacterium RIFCSPLOWO2_02_FULL_37_9]